MTTTRDRLIHTAMQLFAEDGYRATSIADILKVSEVNSGSLYYFFPSKEALLVGVLQTYRENIDEMLLAPVWSGVNNPLDKIFLLLNEYRKILESSDFVYGCPIGNLALELHQPDEAVRNELSGNFAAWRSAVADCLDQASRESKSKIDHDGLATLILTTMEGGVMLSRTFRSLEPFDDAVRHLKLYLQTYFDFN